MEPIRVNDTVVVPARALRMSAARSGGPGGQNVNKVSSKVELRVDIDAIEGMTEEQRRRLRGAERNRLDEDGLLVTMSQLTRSQGQNLEDAREKVRAMVERALLAPKRRVATRPSRGAKKRRVADKRHLADKKQNRKWSPE